MTMETCSPLEMRINEAISILAEVKDNKEEYPILRNKHQLDINTKKVSVLQFEHILDNSKYIFSLMIDPQILKIEISYKKDRALMFSHTRKKKCTDLKGSINPCEEFKSLYHKLKPIWR